MAEGLRWVVELDLEKFVDRVNHDKLMGQVAKRINDKRALKLIRAFLRAEAVAVLGERPVPALLQNLHDRLLDKSIQHSRDAQLAHPPSGLGISTRLTGCGL
jgi:hypothetical protein